jgi:hypothetical protein
MNKHPSIFTRLRSLLALLAASGGVAACATTPSSPNHSKPGGKADGFGSDGTAVECNFHYISDQASMGVYPNLELGSSNHVLDQGYPSFNDTLGDASAPYVATVTVVPFPFDDGTVSKVNGYFALGIKDTANPQAYLASQAEVSLTSLAELPQGQWLEAGSLQHTVAPFTYQGQTWSEVELFCNIYGY